MKPLPAALGSLAVPTVLAALCAAPCRTAVADEKDDRIQQLELDQREMRKELDELKRERGIDPAAIRAAIDDYLAEAGPAGMHSGPGGVLRPSGRVVLGGYFSTRFFMTQYAGEKPAFIDMRLVPQIHADISEGIAFDAEIEFEHGGTADFIDDGEVVVEFAELSFRFNDAFKLKAGTLLVPFGRFNQMHDDPMNDLSTRPNVDVFVIPTAFGLPGIGAEGTFHAGEDVALSYDVVLNNGFKDEIDAEEGTHAARGLYEHDENHDKTVFGRFGCVPTVGFVDALDVGVSGALGAVGEHSERLTGYAVDAAAKTGPWEFKGEAAWLGIDRDPGSAPPIDASGELGPIRGLHGWYAQLLHRFTDPWVRTLPFAQKSASVAAVLRRDSVDLDDRVHGASPQDDECAWTVGVNYRPNSRTVVKIEYRVAESGASGSAGEDRNLFVVEFATYF